MRAMQEKVPHSVGGQATAPPVDSRRTSYSAAATVVDDLAPPVAGHKKGAEKQDRPVLADGRVILTEDDVFEKLGFSWPWWKKWSTLSVIFIIQVSMNFNASIYGNSVSGLTEEFGVSAQAARCGQLAFLIAYAFGCELWAPASEEIGRWPVMQASLFLVNIWQIPCALAPNFATIIICRILGGLSSAGGSVTLGVVADMWDEADQDLPLAFVVLSSVAGSVIGPIVGAFSEANQTWHWIFWLQLIFGGATQIVHFFFVKETLPPALINREAKHRRKHGEPEVYGPTELNNDALKPRNVLKHLARPFIMFVTEPIVLFLSLLSGFSDALIFIFIESYALVYGQWGFGTIEIGLSFIPLLVGYVIAYAMMFPIAYWLRRKRYFRSENFTPEDRLFWLLWTAPLLPIGLWIFAWTSLGPPLHWIGPMIASALIAIANFMIYQLTIGYMCAAYGLYSASATGGNGFARDFLAGIAAIYSIPMYNNVGDEHSLEWASTLLAFLAMVLMIPVFVFYFKGRFFRERSKFAMSLASEKAQKVDKRLHGKSGAQVEHRDLAGDDDSSSGA